MSMFSLRPVYDVFSGKPHQILTVALPWKPERVYRFPKKPENLRYRSPGLLLELF